MTVRPLVSAILIGITGIFLVLAIATLSTTTTNNVDLFVSFWILMPNLVALGAPALLVGGEEESGTLSWLRTLPVTWQNLADAKFLVALAALLITWATSSLLMLLAIATVVPRSTPYADAMFSLGGIGYLLWFSLLLLNCGFVTAYLFRSPVTGLIAVVPLIGFLNLLAVNFGPWIVTGNLHNAGSIESARLSGILLLVLSAAILLVATWSLQRALAYRRLTTHLSSSIKNLAAGKATSAYRPPLSASTTRPKQIVALLWQQLRQMGWPAAAITLMAAMLTLSYLGVVGQDRSFGFLQNEARLLIGLGACWLGGLAFYGDNVRRRCAFFADRGISPTRIWWTRLCFPSLCCLLLLALAVFSGTGNSYRSGSLAIVILLAFTFGQLIGQWMQRPVLTFFAGPACALVALILFLGVVFVWYPGFYWMSIWAVPVLIFASWRLSGRWLSGRVDFGYHWRVFAYTALALVLPALSVVGTRIWTTPELMPQWRAELFTQKVGDASIEDYADIAPGAFNGYGYSDAFKNATPEERLALLRKEVESDRMGEFVSSDDISLLFDRETLSDVDLQVAGLEVVLKWVRMVRQMAADGGATLRDLERVAEPQEYGAVDALERLTAAHGKTAELASLVNAIPDRQLRKQSRRVSLIREWQSYQQHPWRQEIAGQVIYRRNFAHNDVGYTVSWLSFERTRSDRFIDEATRVTLDQLDGRLPETANSPEFLRRNQLWGEAMLPPSPYFSSALSFGSRWTEDYERRIDRLKERFKS